ncbi:hypothetical protein ACFPM0_27595 [Pseudonocardia sulfidoxydans]
MFGALLGLVRPVVVNRALRRPVRRVHVVPTFGWGGHLPLCLL